MRRVIAIVLIIITMMSITSCYKGDLGYSEYSFMAMDTIINIKIYLKENEAKPFFEKSEALVREFEAVLNSHDEDSQVHKFNESETGIDNPSSAVRDIVEFSLNINEKIGGDFDITAAPLFFMWQNYANLNQLPTEEVIAQNLSHVGYDKIALTDKALSKSDPLCKIDLGGIGKGYALGKVKQMLIDGGVDHALINFGGNIAVIGAKTDNTAYKIGIKDPENPNKSACYIDMIDSTIAVSGTYERYVTIQGEKYHHIIDPKTGYPSDSGLASVAVISKNSTLADALSTAFLVMGKEKTESIYGEHIFDFEAVFIDNEGNITYTEGLNNQLIIGENNVK